MGRMLYPSFYFDICEKIINEREEESKLVPIIKRSKEYEEYVDKIFTIINEKSKIKNIDWLWLIYISNFFYFRNFIDY